MALLLMGCPSDRPVICQPGALDPSWGAKAARPVKAP